MMQFFTTMLAMDEQKHWYLENIALRNQVIVDVGANVGELSQFFSAASKSTSQVVSIEPVVENVARIRERIARTSMSDQWRVESCAISNVRGWLHLKAFRTPEGAINSVVVDAGEVDARRVPARTLMELVPNATVVKLDVEGHEYAVLGNALPQLRSVHTWAVELHRMPGQPLERVLVDFTREGFELFAAGREAKQRGGRWRSVKIPSSLTWADVPVAQVRPDGSVFKMLHILAKR